MQRREAALARRRVEEALDAARLAHETAEELKREEAARREAKQVRRCGGGGRRSRCGGGGRRGKYSLQGGGRTVMGGGDAVGLGVRVSGRRVEGCMRRGAGCEPVTWWRLVGPGGGGVAWPVGLTRM